MLHVGLPKTGTTFLQKMLAGHRRQLRAQDVQYPDLGPSGMFRAAVDLRDLNRYWGLDPADTAGLWRELCTRAREFPGTTVMGHEILSGARPETIARVAEDLADVDLEVLVTARDLGRQVPAWWQESVKNDRAHSFSWVLDKKVLAPLQRGERRNQFWRSQDLGAVVRRWSDAAQGARLHVVVNPAEGPPTVLWQRFAEAVGLRDQEFEVNPPRNQSLGVTEVALLRDTIHALGGRIQKPESSRVVKRYLAQGVLSAHSSRRARTPSSAYGPLREVTRQWIREIEHDGHRVHGSLEELDPIVAAPDEPAVDDVPAEDIARLAPEVMADMLVEVSRLRREVAENRSRWRRVRAELTRVRAEIEESPEPGARLLLAQARRLADRARRSLARTRG